MKSGKVLLGLLAGVAGGALLGILFAPDKGSNTRKKIKAKGDDYVDELKERFDSLLDSFSEKFESKKKEAEDYVALGKSKYQEYKNEAANGAPKN